MVNIELLIQAYQGNILIKSFPNAEKNNIDMAIHKSITVTISEVEKTIRYMPKSFLFVFQINNMIIGAKKYGKMTIPHPLGIKYDKANNSILIIISDG